ncbi:DUF2855 family protein [Glacieibacterium frigidum]|uniref:DUF2855 family protein n=1 Tax=Glacieibacterium frigidum TaxID=2593303 RepID=A0A552UFM8_9SPHN|nr:DUF2855 family protein [Glacieibacterium frigidum]TRW17023.1 DUF2855 family protein [Glacieibacterium frigidum]
MDITELLIDRTDLASAHLATRTAAVGEGQAAFAVETFALTANNVTYAAHGKDMRYWDFFPAPEGHGIVPVWGFGRCVESRVEGIAVGDRAYGYWPCANGAVLTPAKVTPRGFVDAAAHRSELSAVYNGYLRADPAMGDERIQALFRPLYITSFLLDAQLGEGGGTAVLSSASSKTALGFAHALKARGNWHVVGLTSRRHVSFVAATGCYDSVVPYDEVGSLTADSRAIFVDFAGDGALRAAVHAALKDGLAASIVVGDTHWDVAGNPHAVGPKPQFFFAPAVLADRLKDWGQAGFDARLAAGWTAFTAAAADWLRVVDRAGMAEAQDIFTALVAGRVDPAEGIIVRP